MNTLLAISGVGVCCRIAEIFNLRKLFIPVAILGLIAILGLTITAYNLPSTHFNNMIIVDRFSVSFSSLFIVLTIFLVALSGDYYKEHIDGGFNLEVKRTVSFIFYLNDSFTGGGTYFPKQDVTISPNIGDVLIFPSSYTHPHEAQTITEGTKYSAVIWSY